MLTNRLNEPPCLPRVEDIACAIEPRLEYNSCLPEDVSEVQNYNISNLVAGFEFESYREQIKARFTAEKQAEMNGLPVDYLFALLSRGTTSSQN